MKRKYKNWKIYVIYKVSIILSIMSLVCVIIYFISTPLNINNIVFASYYYIYSVSAPVHFALKSINGYRDRLGNDLAVLKFAIIYSLFPFIILWVSTFFYIVIALFSNDFSILGNTGKMAYNIGRIVGMHFLIYITDILFIINSILIQKEWIDNPPPFVRQKILKKQEEEKKRERIRLEQKKAEEIALSKTLIEKCGIKFFIKYFKQIKNLPLRDVVVTENYSPAEKEERLLAAKEIIESGLTEITLREIIKTYSEFLSQDEIKNAQILLNEEKVKTL